MFVVLPTQGYAVFRNDFLQKLQQSFLKLGRFPALTHVLPPISTIGLPIYVASVPAAPFSLAPSSLMRVRLGPFYVAYPIRSIDDVMANRQTSVSRAAARGTRVKF